jgi:ribosomal protein L23
MGLVGIIQQKIDFFKQKQVNTKKITILLDNGYHKDKIETELQKIYSQILTKIRIKVTPKPKKDKRNPGFKPVHKRWVIERSNSWMEKCRSLWKNCEGKITTSEAKIRLCFIRLILRRLTRG